MREGLFYEMLPQKERAEDGLICAAQNLNRLLSRSARHADELVAWTDRLVRVVHLRETQEDRRLRHAACLMSDIGWRVHPDHRGRGYAQALLSAVSRQIVARGEIPFLHVFTSNASAIALYRRQGMEIRRRLHVTVLQRQG